MKTFRANTVQRAWDRQKGRCAYCGKRLVRSNRDTGSSGAWHAHHRKPVSYGGSHQLGNCALLCINPPKNCHFYKGHEGNTHRRVILYDYELRYLYGGDPLPLDRVETPLDKVKTPLDRIRPLL